MHINIQFVQHSALTVVNTDTMSTIVG